MTTSATCSFCHTLTADRYCPACGHRADAARLDCDCASCRRHQGPTEAEIRDALDFGKTAEQHLRPY